MIEAPEQSVVELPAGRVPPALIEHIQRKADGSFVVVCNGYPYHATASDTPAIFEQVQVMLAAGEPCSDYIGSATPSEDLQQAERLWRDGEIERIKWLRERHRDEQDMQVSTTLTLGQFSELLVYIQQLRDWPAANAFPDNSERPVRPGWLQDVEGL